MHRSIPHPKEDRHHGLLDKIARTTVRCAQSLSCITTTEVPEEQVVPDTLDLQDDLRYQEVLVRILDTMTKRTRAQTIKLCKVQWSGHSEAEAMWEREDALKEEFPHLFEDHSKSRGRDSI
jgi:hypothetical protein